MTTYKGIRVVRGPGWSHGNEDGGQGHLGTVTSIPGGGPSHGKVSVVWDSIGVEKSYSAGKDNKFELRIYDNAPTGIKHPSVTCDVCKTNNITGIRWKCAVCTNYDLCSPCYHSGRHDTSHAFLKYLTATSRPEKSAPRSSSTQNEIFGLVKGAEVARGIHWNFENQDGGAGKRGKIVDVGTFTGGFYRGGVRVKWDHKPDVSIGYRIGAEGIVHLIATSETSGGTYYPDHLPLLDVLTTDRVVLRCSDKVKVDLDLHTFKKLQKEHQSGWNDGMKQCLQEIGTIVAAPHHSFFKVQYEDARVWNVVSIVLQKVGSFQKRDKVRITDSYNAAVELQVGHGGWNEDMEKMLGEFATVLDIDGDGDLKVEVGGQEWLVNPTSCSVHFDPGRKPTTPPVKPASPHPDSKYGESQILAKLPIVLSSQGTQVAEYLQAAYQGDLQKIKAFVSKNKDKINVQVQGSTALLIASYFGHVDIVQYLLANGAEKNVADAEGDTALHFAVGGEQTAIMEELCKAGINMNVQNKDGVTALHKAVDQNLLECVQILLRHGADVNLQDKMLDTPTHDSIKKGYRDITRALVDYPKLDGTKANNDKLNIMHVAVINGQQRVVEVLISRNKKLASITGGDDSWTPLHMAAMNGHTAVAGVLLKKGNVDINAVDKNSRTPLHYAVQSCQNTMIDLLLGKDADPNRKDRDGNTPAHLAQMAKLPTAGLRGKKDEDVLVQSILCMLCECGADLNIKNKKGKTPLDLCASKELVSKLRGIAEKVKSQQPEKDDIPPHWTPMNDRELVVQELSPNDALTAEEYNNVSHKFLRTMANVKVTTIKRIQNRTLWDVYNVTKRSMERKYGIGCANELNLFHGTPATAVEPIQHQNIDPLLAGSNVGAIWGKGAYFAVDSKQSDSYTSACDEGYRYIFMARVLAGRVAQGSKTLQRPPPMDESTPNDLADTVVDNTSSPRTYVVFRNQQIYPEFLVQYV